jgi:hypothetical protein
MVGASLFGAPEKTFLCLNFFNGKVGARLCVAPKKPFALKD